MDINAGNIRVLTGRFSTALNKRILTTETLYKKIAMIIPSSSGENLYARVPDLDGLREWVGERVVQQLGVDGRMAIRNKTFEKTIGVRREDIEDDQFGFLLQNIEQMGDEAASLPDNLIFKLLEEGEFKKGMDAPQNFFDRDHLGYDSSGKKVSFSNLLKPSDIGDGAEGGPAWYLFCTKQPLKPMIFQPRRAPKFTAKTNLNDDNVLMENNFRWMIDMRCAAGFGMYQMALKCTAKLTPDNLGKAISVMENQYRADGTPLKTSPDALFVPSNLRGVGNQILKNELIQRFDAKGQPMGLDSNPWVGTLDLTHTAHLSSKAAA